MTDNSDGKGVARAAIEEMRRMLSRDASSTPNPVDEDDYDPRADQEQMTVMEKTSETVEDLLAALESAALRLDDGTEYWSARQLQTLLGYGSSWQNFQKVIDKAQIACHQSDHTIRDHFNDVIKMVDIGSGAERTTKDVQVTRYGAYLIAQNGDSRKRPVAFAQTYFATQARRQELQNESDSCSAEVAEDQKRLMLRDEMREHNKQLADAAKDAGVEKPIEYAIFQNHGYQGLYGGLDRAGIQKKKGLKGSSNILDHMGSTELAANLFRATQTEDKLRRENVKGKNNANSVHFEVGQKVRKTIAEIGGIMPEHLEAAEDLVKVGRRLEGASATGRKTKKIK
ncbi:DNA damage-inducible protein D [Janthinobacterium sp. HLX7-2]|uniref:DNA damage-inducible protein D n=1 Tax=Janthinobacterium sp. HLX7-2 TaxID=1259331 RepID=UPI003F24B7A9